MAGRKDPTIKERLIKVEICVQEVKESTDEIKKDVKDLRRIILGNGHSGLATKVSNLELKEKRQFNFIHAITIAIISAIATFAVASVF